MKQIQDIEPYVHNLCRQPSNLFGPSFYDLHIKQVEKYSLQLSERLNADKVVVQIAALMHDVAAISDSSLLAQHAEKALKWQKNYLKISCSRWNKRKRFCIASAPILSQLHLKPIFLKPFVSRMPMLCRKLHNPFIGLIISSE